MEDEVIEEFNERFATVEEALKYIADSQAKSEFASKRASAIHEKEIAQIRALQDRTEQNLELIQHHFSHITKVLRSNIEEYEFQEDKLTKAGEILTSKRKK